MPLYEYQCLQCGTRTEVLQKFSDPPPSACEKCGGELKRLPSAPSVQFKGAGWYVTDYARKGGGPATGESKSEGGGEGKPAGGSAVTAEKSGGADSSSAGSATSASSGGSASGATAGGGTASSTSSSTANSTAGSTSGSASTAGSGKSD